MSELLDFLNKAKATNETISALVECVSIADALKKKARHTEEEKLHQICEAMENLYKDFKKRTSAIKQDLNKMKEENNRHLDRYGFDRSFATRNSFMQNLLRRLSLVIQDFGRVQGGFATNQKERLKEQYLIANPDATATELNHLEEKEKGKLILQSAFTLGNKTAKEALLLAEKRRTSLEILLEGITDLKDLADDFSAIIRNDTCEMDKIHMGVNYANVQTGTAHKLINKTTKRKIRLFKAKKTTTLLGIIILFVILFLLIFKIAH
ncbi:hypothetical protein NEPAR06_1380 [Nematocida parisii]|uniref:t-SNARE coiled-coil homology domain-containing protein n=1 Tax=Nematocida parisii (strain ERTm3) TaxID=935791 RepID=I3EKG0_NEMP3|nr:uncharacterized protein NEPG_00758 [Nematocida parisii ERTm1]EIJ89707.1 hypothetical protein NEQG_00477 [Nematocida parisii ERTm3]KAI5141065.1 hypothetical protein NEPAR04_0703 [Nematocida parisii]EIJ94091.1 hypothetical protein NEPG_00758 [Nematocida parisii ERTm1]KAI5143405.1 hypothetical protein NEPAR07_0625 [Nematocida parisii]KAI5154914.1 hypothetical protein NEPAR06_1380 [Nematocida parisii]|eukprot:XP_013058587.1 hypothetical protein NEPG_00758 [Nematocida parisii ERTm1]